MRRNPVIAGFGAEAWTERASGLSTLCSAPEVGRSGTTGTVPQPDTSSTASPHAMAEESQTSLELAISGTLPAPAGGQVGLPCPGVMSIVMARGWLRAQLQRQVGDRRRARVRDELEPKLAGNGKHRAIHRHRGADQLAHPLLFRSDHQAAEKFGS